MSRNISAVITLVYGVVLGVKIMVSESPFDNDFLRVLAGIWVIVSAIRLAAHHIQYD